MQTLGDVLRLTDVELALWIFKHIYPEHKAGSESKQQRPLLIGGPWSKYRLATVDNLRNLFLTKTTEMLTFFQRVEPSVESSVCKYLR